MLFTIISIGFSWSYYIFYISIFILEVFHTVLPYGLDLGLIAFAAYHLTKLPQSDLKNVEKVLGFDPASPEGMENPKKTVKCIAHRGACLDAPENTLPAFKYCVERGCRFVEVDIRVSRDGRLVLFHDDCLQRLAGDARRVRDLSYAQLKDVDISLKHPNRDRFSEAGICLLDEALDYFLENDVRVVLDIKGTDSRIVEGVVAAFANRPTLYDHAVVTCFHPLVMYQIRKSDPRIVGAMSYRPHGLTIEGPYDSRDEAPKKKYPNNPIMHYALSAAEQVYGWLWRRGFVARWCGLSLVLLHKDIASTSEVSTWRGRGVRVGAWSVNQPLEKLYFSRVAMATYLADTLVAEPHSHLTQEDGERRQSVEDGVQKSSSVTDSETGACSIASVKESPCVSPMIVVTAEDEEGGEGEEDAPESGAVDEWGADDDFVYTAGDDDDDDDDEPLKLLQNGDPANILKV